MYKNRRIAVVVPVYNEEKLVGKVLDTMPGYVDKMIVVDDKSRDRSVDVIKPRMSLLGDKLILIKNTKNQGVGAAIVSGYKRAIQEKADIVAVMAGDAQMDPKNLPSLLDPVVAGETDYAKGNRLITGRAWGTMPAARYFGNSFLSLFTKIASGYWHIADFQNGYTAISSEALRKLRLDQVYKRYGMPNDMLVHLNLANCRVKDIPMDPVYNIGERSGIKLWKVIPTLSWLLLRRFSWRLKEKYVIRDFHPLVFFYLLGLTLFPVGTVYGIYLVFLRIFYGPVSATSALFAAFLFISGLQSLFFAMWFDMEANKDLK